MPKSQKTSKIDPTPADAFYATALRVAGTGIVLTIVVFIAAALSGHAALQGALWGGGAGIVLTAITTLTLVIPWDRYPLLASSGVVISFIAKIVVMVALVLLAGSHKNSFSSTWFFASFALILLAITGVEVVGLAREKTTVVQPLDTK